MRLAASTTSGSPISLVIASIFAFWRSVSRRFHACCRNSNGHITESIPASDTARRMNGATVVGKSIPPASPQAATVPPYRVIESTLARVVEPTEFGHIGYHKGLSYEDYLGERGRKLRGNKKWRQSVHDVVEQLRRAFEVDYVVLGGGNAARLRRLPAGARLGDNRNALLGGLRLWRQRGGRLLLDGAAPRSSGSRR